MDETVKAILQGFPTFAGLVIAILIQREQNIKLMALLERRLRLCDEVEATDKGVKLPDPE